MKEITRMKQYTKAEFESFPHDEKDVLTESLQFSSPLGTQDDPSDTDGSGYAGFVEKNS